MLYKRNIHKVAVLGSGIMGSRIACLFAGAGVKVLLLDIPTPGSKDEKDKNKMVNDALTAAAKSSPSPLYTKDVLKNILDIRYEISFDFFKIIIIQLSTK